MRRLIGIISLLALCLFCHCKKPTPPDEARVTSASRGVYPVYPRGTVSNGGGCSTGINPVARCGMSLVREHKSL